MRTYSCFSYHCFHKHMNSDCKIYLSKVITMTYNSVYLCVCVNFNSLFLFSFHMILSMGIQLFNILNPPFNYDSNALYTIWSVFLKSQCNRILNACRMNRGTCRWCYSRQCLKQGLETLISAPWAVSEQCQQVQGVGVLSGQPWWDTHGMLAICLQPSGLPFSLSGVLLILLRSLG